MLLSNIEGDDKHEPKFLCWVQTERSSSPASHPPQWSYSEAATREWIDNIRSPEPLIERAFISTKTVGTAIRSIWLEDVLVSTRHSAFISNTHYKLISSTSNHLYSPKSTNLGNDTISLTATFLHSPSFLAMAPLRDSVTLAGTPWYEHTQSSTHSSGSEWGRWSSSTAAGPHSRWSISCISAIFQPKWKALTRLLDSGQIQRSGLDWFKS